MSARETALAALHALVAATFPDLDVYRTPEAPIEIPDGESVTLLDGEVLSETRILSPYMIAIEWQARVEVHAPDRDRLDAMLMALGAAIEADRTLGGAVEFADVSTPETAELGGAPPLRSASVPITLQFTAAGTPLS